MLKTIKKKKNVRTDELFKYITMNAHTLLAGKKIHIFRSNTGHEVTIDEKGNVNFSFMHYTPEDLFQVEIEEEITEDMKFDLLLELWLDDGEYRTYLYTNNSIAFLKDSNSVSFYALIDGRLQLIWERENI